MEVLLNLFVQLLNDNAMKTKQLLFAMFLGIAFSATACKRCQTCTDQQSGYETEVCRGRNPVPGVYEAQIRNLEDSGYECN